MRTAIYRTPHGHALRIVERIACLRAEEQTRAPWSALREPHGLAKPAAVYARRYCRCGKRTQAKSGVCAACRTRRNP